MEDLGAEVVRRSPYGVNVTRADLDIEGIYFENNLRRLVSNYDSHRLIFGPERTELLIEHFIAVSKAAVGDRKSNYFAWENPYGAAGGIYPVAKILVQSLIEAGEDIERVSPFHSRLKTRIDLRDGEQIAEFPQKFGPIEHVVRAYRHIDSQGMLWNLLDTEHFFNADGGHSGTSPYIYNRESSWDAGGENSLLGKDGMFFGFAAMQFLKEIGRAQNTLNFMQDWQTSPIALAMCEEILKGNFEGAASVLCLHNSFDHSCSEENISMVSENCTGHQYAQLVSGRDGTISPCRDTFLTRFGPLANRFCTVSERFAKDLKEDPLQTKVIAPHLEWFIKEKDLVGIIHENMKPKQVQEVLTGSSVEQDRARLKSKMAKRKIAIEILAGFDKSKCIGELTGPSGSDLRNLPDNYPLIMAAGRLDKQKGYDKCIFAADRFLKERAKFVQSASDKVKFIFILGANKNSENDMKQLETFKRIAEAHKGDILIYTERMNQGFDSLIAGIDIVVSPSTYEPCGFPSEVKICGTINLVRKTGGLEPQIKDFSEYGSREATGFAYDDVLPSGINLIEELAFIHNEYNLDYLYKNSKLFRYQVKSLAHAFVEPVRVIRHNRKAYARILGNIEEDVAKMSWADRAVPKYQMLFQGLADS